jgi:hypothetical protein
MTDCEILCKVRPVYLLSDADDVEIEPWQTYLSSFYVMVNRPNIVAISTDPSVSALRVRFPGGRVQQPIPFTDADLATRVAKAIRYAIELCSRRSAKPEPF